MAQSFEVTEKINNGKTLATPLTKSYNTQYVERARGVDATGTDDTEIFLAGRNTKDLRRVDENYATVLAAMNAPVTTDIEKGLSLTVKYKQGDLPENVTPYLQIFGKHEIVEYFADPNNPTDTVIIVATGETNIEREVYFVDEEYPDVKAKWLL